IDLQAVLDKGNFQLFRVQAAAERFQGLARLLIGRVSSWAVAAGLRELAAQEVRLVSENWSLQSGNFGDGSVGFRLCGGKFANLQRNPRKQKMRKSRLAGKGRLIEKFGGTSAKASSFKIASLVEQKQALIEIEKPGPDEIFFLGEQGGGFCEEFKSVDGFSLLAVGDCPVRNGFSGFVAHTEFFEAKKALGGIFAVFFAGVALE